MAKAQTAATQANTPEPIDMMEKLAHLDWAIESRHKNQQCSLKLLKLFNDYGSKWITKDYSRAAQDLVAVAFSLWRAAFLADKESKRKKVFEHGKYILGQLIENNAIAYPQDRAAKEWTFNYYIRNARAALNNLADHWPIVPKYAGGAMKATDRWDYCHELLVKAVVGFEAHLKQKQAEAEQARQRAINRKRRKANRQKVRALTFEARKKAAGN